MSVEAYDVDMSDSSSLTNASASIMNIDEEFTSSPNTDDTMWGGFGKAISTAGSVKDEDVEEGNEDGQGNNIAPIKASPLLTSEVERTRHEGNDDKAGSLHLTKLPIEVTDGQSYTL